MKHFLSAFLGTVLGIVVIVSLALGVGSCVTGKKPKIKDHSYLVIDLTGQILEYDPPGGPLSAVTAGDTETLQRVLSNLQKAARDDRIEGVILRVGWGYASGFATVQEIRQEIARLRESGKKVYGWAESFQAREYLLLAACDEIYAPPTAYILFKGFRGRAVHVKNALDKLGVRPNVHQIKDYKSAAELVTRDSMSEAARENNEWLLDEAWEIFTATLERDRGLSEEKIRGLMEHAYFTSREALEGGLIDRISYWDELEAKLKIEDEDELRTVSQSRYAQVKPGKLGLKGDKTIAVIHAQGTIMGRRSGVNPLLGITMGHETIVAEFRRARLDDDVAAIVFRVDSGGGDALGSDLISREVEITSAVKPVVVSMVDVAGSGGYDIAYRGSRILVDPMTVTGSIGSISGKFNTAGLYEKLGITWSSVTRGPNAMIDSGLRDYTPEERARFEDNHWDTFNEWLRDVAERRGMSFEEAELLAHGRVWSGRQAVENGLVDEIGDLHRAVEVAKELAGIDADEGVNLTHYPKKKGLLQSVMGGDAEVAAASRWMIYRALREDVAETLEFARRHPELVMELTAP